MSAKFPRGGGGANPFSAIRLLVMTCMFVYMYEGQLISNLPTLLSIEIDHAFFHEMNF